MWTQLLEEIQHPAYMLVLQPRFSLKWPSAMSVGVERREGELLSRLEPLKTQRVEDVKLSRMLTNSKGFAEFQRNENSLLTGYILLQNKAEDTLNW